MEPIFLVLIFAAGFAAGVINTMAGGGSLLTLPLLIFAGLPPTVANGTNRIAIVFQNLGAMAGFQRGGYTVDRAAAMLLIPSILGAILGIRLATDIDETTMSRAIGIMPVVRLVPRLKPRKPAAATAPKRAWGIWPAYFVVGVYGGFLQAGVGFLYLALLAGAQGMDLVRANLIKVFLILVYSVIAVGMFAAAGQIAWIPGVALAVGTTAGGWLGAHVTIKGGERWIRVALVLAILASAAKLWGWPG